MSDAKLQVKIGGVEFSGEGSEKWLSEQLKEILAAAPKLAVIAPATATTTTTGAAGGAGGHKPARAAGTFTQTLASYLTAHQAGGNQVKRFLATADWLRLKGQPLSTASVAKALKDFNQGRLGNPSDILNKNVGKGYIEKTDDGGFVITADGLKSLGHAVE